MTNNPRTPTSLAHALLQARHSGELLDADDWADVVRTPADAQAVQAAMAPALGWRVAGSQQGPGRVPGYWKSGAPRRDAPLTHAPLPEEGVWASPSVAGGAPLHLRGIEAEIALRLGREVTAEMAAALQPGEGLELIDGITAAIEVVDTRWRQHLKAPPLLLAADGLCHGALVLGPWQDASRLLPRESPRDWSAQVCRLRVGAAPLQAFTGTHPLGDPLWLLAGWLQELVRRYGSVPAGTVVTTGTWNGLAFAQAGDLVVAELDGIAEARLQL
ncbi:fumarylacetoacetate hydrolase family protein [Delftia tsuruhatensis]|uniref:fumarylacetoacetate hydrolase family protein n=1 Tax=Delftia tsuruhatensis TaxID=180282 RepID=UPI001055C566|nr:fumarylacetoacetate hydrolase family protein [Delftia tsuruhatensis]TDF31192.1 fumarylacetoacetate hydrolase family protein [Delftia tsuruhatensis]